MQRTLPDVAEIVQRAQGVPQVGIIRSEYALDANIIMQEGAQQAMGGIVQSVGLPALDVFKTVVKSFKIDVAGEVVEKLEHAYGTVSAALASMNSNADQAGGAAMNAAANTGVTFGMQAVTAVPVAGMVVRLAWSVGKLIYGIAQLAKAQKSYGPVAKRWPKSRFDPTLDNRLLNRGVLDQMRQLRDWSLVFSPPSLGTGVGTLPPYGIKRLDSGGIEIFRRSGYDENGLPNDWAGNGWVGMVPGTATLHAGVGVDGMVVGEIGDSLFPSARGIATWAWKQLTSKDPLASIFTVHADAVSGRWEAYIHDLHQFIAETGALNVDQKSQVMKKFNAGPTGERIFGWGTSIEPRENEWDAYQPARVCDTLRARQFKACDTLLIAYVDDTFGAFKDDALRARFRQRRKDLLEHPAICDVELDSVIDADYRDALISAGAGALKCASIAPKFTATPVDPFKPVGDTGEGGEGGLGGLDDLPAKGSRGWILGAGALAALAYFMTRK